MQMPSPNIRRIFRPMVDLLYPPQCRACGDYEVGEGPFCRPCDERWQQECGLPACPTCASTVAAYELVDGRCGECRVSGSRLDAIVRVGPYAGVLGELLRAYKYRGREELQSVLAGALTDRVRRAVWLERAEAVTFVPAHWWSKVTRPLHAAEALAEGTAARLGLACVRLLRRARLGLRQVGLSPTRRWENVRGAFAIRPGVRLNGARLLLIDDVRTTGATIEECAKVLRAAGAAEVYGAVVARGGSEQVDVASGVSAI